MRVRRSIGSLSLVVVAAATSPLLWAGPRIYMVHEDRVVLVVRPLSVSGETLPSQEIVLGRDPAVPVTLDVAWPLDGTRSRLTLEARRVPSPEGSPQRVRLRASVAVPGRDPILAERDLAFHDSTLALFEICRRGTDSLTLAVEARHTSEDVPYAHPVIGAPVVLKLEIQRVEGSRSTSLETNQLHTFVGEPVGYSFRLGEGEQTVSLEVRLRPLQLTDDVARIEIEVTGVLHSLLISRREQWITTREATSTLEVVDGAPPMGYRFLVTPRF